MVFYLKLKLMNMTFSHCEKNPFGVTLIKVGPSGIGMDEADDNEEALVVESYKTFIKIKEEPDPGTFPLIFSLVFIFIIPIFSFDFEGIFYGDYSSCFGSVLIGFALLGLAAILSQAQSSRYKKATQRIWPMQRAYRRKSLIHFSVCKQQIRE